VSQLQVKAFSFSEMTRGNYENVHFSFTTEEMLQFGFDLTGPQRKSKAVKVSMNWFGGFLF